jgi:hypothetical protein
MIPNEGDKFDALAALWGERLREVDYDSLPLSEYNKSYLASVKPALEYYLKIYARCLRQGIRALGMEAEAVTLVDYGGGSGFLGLLAKAAGVGRVIYVDVNPLSVEAAGILKRRTGMGADVLLQGDSPALAAYCRANGIVPQLLIAADLIEHVYRLPDFFADLYAINPRMRLVFTTASNPCNPLLRRRLRRFMRGCESGNLVSPNYLGRREAFIRRHYPRFRAEEVKVWGRRTRGLTYGDMRKVIEEGRLPLPPDKYNTCDPATGNWAERVLPLRAYRSAGAPYGYALSVGKGFYNVRRGNRLFGGLCRLLNALIRSGGRAGLVLSPFIVLWYEPSGKKHDR